MFSAGTVQVASQTASCESLKATCRRRVSFGRILFWIQLKGGTAQNLQIQGEALSCSKNIFHEDKESLWSAHVQGSPWERPHPSTDIPSSIPKRGSTMNEHVVLLGHWALGCSSSHWPHLGSCLCEPTTIVCEVVGHGDSFVLVLFYLVHSGMTVNTKF